MASSAPPNSLSRLPPELLTQIITHVHLSSPAPSETRLHQKPKDNFLAQPSDSTPLKNISLTSRLLRTIALPLLFQHAIWYMVDTGDLRAAHDTFTANPSSDPPSTFSILRFLCQNGLAQVVQTLTLVVIEERHTMEMSLASFEVSRKGSCKANIFLWETILGTLPLRRLTIQAWPNILRTMVTYTAGEGCDTSGWHILSLTLDDAGSRAPLTGEGASLETSSAVDSDSASTSSASPTAGAIPQTLLALRPWTSVLVNEGSFFNFYRLEDGYYERQPCSILPALLDGDSFPRCFLPRDDAREAPEGSISIPPSFPPTAHTFTYIAEFPTTDHFVTIPNNLPRIKHLNLQLTPANLDLNTSPDPYGLRKESIKMWSERNQCYGLALQALFQGGNWNHLETFDSADQADGEAWEAAAEWASGSRGRVWKVAGDGVMLVERPEDPDDEEFAAHPGELKRVAFRGTAELPVSPMAMHQIL